MGWYKKLSLAQRIADDAGLSIDFRVRIGNREIDVHELAEALNGSVARNGDIFYPGRGGERSAILIFDDKADHGYRLSDAYSLNAKDRRLQDEEFRAIVGLQPGERIETCGDELLVHARSEALARRIIRADKLWEEAQASPTDVVLRYLSSRGITLPLPPALRATVAWHPSERKEYPAMIALVSDPASRKPLGGVHLTALCKDGSAKADISSNAKWTSGNIKGGVIRLAEPVDGRIAIAEGIETALSYAQLTKLPTWSALNAGNIKEVVLPTNVRHAVIAADNDPRGRHAAKLALKQFQKRDSKLTVDLDWPIVVGRDWNDILVRGYLG